ncbi:F-box domain-containing [Fusarium albosuccineum]|uniref:F-box domain-containing n=1 Tax=Fusarium albosuccineum TaxID=1237068 RepID=A0A8H4LQU1_9HYPO|nr:F-box domain-containing [Fusarium albosuccineum]
MSSFLRNRRPTPGPGAEYGSGLVKPTYRNKGESSRLTLMALPTEIHLAISKLLIYPDALSLKHTNAHFYSLVDTGIRLKVEWLVERRSLHLECPNDRRCDLGSDLRFCRGTYSCNAGENISSANPGLVSDALYMAQEHAHTAQLSAGDCPGGSK